MAKVPDLSISPEKVFFVIAKSRQAESSAAGLEADADSDDDMPQDHSGRTARTELSGFIRDLNEDEQMDLVALMWPRRCRDRELARAARGSLARPQQAHRRLPDRHADARRLSRRGVVGVRPVV
jgi:Protein of unknown function (DUF3775)